MIHNTETVFRQRVIDRLPVGRFIHDFFQSSRNPIGKSANLTPVQKIEEYFRSQFQQQQKKDNEQNGIHKNKQKRQLKIRGGTEGKPNTTQASGSGRPV